MYTIYVDDAPNPCLNAKYTQTSSTQKPTKPKTKEAPTTNENPSSSLSEDD